MSIPNHWLDEDVGPHGHLWKYWVSALGLLEVVLILWGGLCRAQWRLSLKHGFSICVTNCSPRMAVLWATKMMILKARKYNRIEDQRKEMRRDAEAMERSCYSRNKIIGHYFVRSPSGILILGPQYFLRLLPKNPGNNGICYPDCRTEPSRIFHSQSISL